MMRVGSGRTAGDAAWTAIWIAAVAGLLVAAPALAQEAATKPPAIEPPGKASGILSYLVAAVLGFAAVGLCAMPSRRTHQD